VSNRKLPKFRNLFLQPTCKPLYSQVFTNSTCTKLKTNGNLVAIPDQNGTCVGILTLPKSLLHKDVVKMANHAPFSLQHGKPIQEFEFSSKSYSSNIIATSTKTDNILRIWKIDSFDMDVVQTFVETDTPFYLLAGHEKRVDNIKFHTCLDIVASSSQDKTVKIWNLPTLEEKLSLVLPNDATALSFCFNQEYDYLLAGGSDGFISLFDPRASAEAVLSGKGKHSLSKEIRLSMLQTSPYFISTGFGLTDPNRNLVLMDLRNLQKEIQEISITESSPNLLCPTADANLPLLYLSGRGEGIRVYEFNDGELSLNTSVKFEKPNSAVEIIPNPDFDKKKCEIGRFISLSSEKTLELASLCVPRAKSESVIQQDLYPALKSLPLISAEEWFENTSIPLASLGDEEELEPIHNLQDSIKVATTGSGKAITINRGQNPTVKRRPSLKKTKTLNTKMHVKVNSGVIAENESIDAMAGYLDQEIRGWFSNDYVKRWVCPI
jgi:WD40 repeat protein